MSQIFISYVAEDAGIVREIARGLEAAGYHTWYFEHNVVSGSSYVKQISQALDQCQAFVVVASPRSVGSDQVTKEVMGAFERGKPFFPVLIELRPSKLKQLQPEWRHAIGVTSMVIMGPEGVPVCCTRIIDGLKALGIQPKSTGATAARSTPKHLAEKIIAARSSMEGERKQVTVLLAEVSRFTSMGKKLDPEEELELTNKCLDLISEEVHCYEGTVAKYFGNEVMALFGAPIAHEYAPQRALYAALGIRERLIRYAAELRQQGIEFELRIGANTGLVVVGKISDELVMEFISVGDTVDFASRMKNAAGPATIQVTESTYRVTEGYFEFKPAGEIEVKGEKLPLRSYQVLGTGKASTRLGVAITRGLTQFVGRNRELEHLMDCFPRAKEGKGQAVGIVGEPGVGKSRLILELQKTLPAGEHTYLEGRCLHHGADIAYTPLLDILKSYFGVQEGQAEPEVKSMLEQKVKRLDKKLEGILPPLHDILSLEVEDETYRKLEPQPKGRRTFEAISSLLIRESQNRPLVLCVEDLHWIDKTSQEFLNYFIPSLANTHILLLLLYRPEYTHPWGSKTYYSQVRVDELSLETSAEMVQGILKEGKAAPELSELILTRAAGNPLFLEELTRTLLDQGYIEKKDGHYVLVMRTSDIQVPHTIQGIIAARIDRLEENHKHTLQVASVVGREFAYPILQAITGMQEELKEHLCELQELEFIYEKNLFPELEYMFKHALTQEVAYNSLLLKRRKEIHERIGRAIEELYPNRLEEFCETLAFHFRQGESLNKAVDYLIKSGEKSLNRYAVEESHQHFKNAYEILSGKPGKTKEEERLLIDMLMKWAYVFYFRGDFKELTALLWSHVALAESLDDKERLGMFYAWLGFAIYERCEFRNSYQYLRKALRIGEEIGSQRVIGYACCWLTWTCIELGLLDEALAFGERAADIARGFESDQYLYYKSLAGVGRAYWFTGNRRNAISTGQALLEYGHNLASIRAMVLGHLALGMSCEMDGDFTSALECIRQAIEVSADPFYEFNSKLYLGQYYLLNGLLQEAEETVQQVLAFGQEYGCDIFGDAATLLLSFIAILKGDLDEGQRAGEAAIQKCLAAGCKSTCAIAYRSFGNLFALMVGSAPSADRKASEHLNKAIEITSEIGAKGMLGSACLDLGLLHKTNDQNGQARECITNAIALFEQCGLENYLRQAREALKSLQ